MLLPDKVKSLPGYKRIDVTCDKCHRKSTIETDYLTETQAKSQHKCKGGKGEKGKQAV